MAHPFEGIERKIAGMGEGMIPDTMSFFDDLPEPVSYTHLDVYKRQVGQCPRFTGKCTQIVLQLDATVSTAITALMRGHFLLPVQDLSLIHI